MRFGTILRGPKWPKVLWKTPVRIAFYVFFPETWPRQKLVYALLDERGGGSGGNGGNDPGRAVLMALDTDKNHEISAAEISNAPAALLELDSNGDGKLSDSDLASAGGRRGQGSRGERQRGKQEGAGSDRKNGPRGQHTGGPPEPAQMVEHAMQMETENLTQPSCLKFA